jgi:hypothetical protein
MRKSLIACLAFVLVLAGGLVALLGPRHCPVDRAAFERVEEGMTRAEVHAILGGPQGEYATRPVDYYSLRGGPHRSEQWYGDEGAVYVVFYPGSHETVIYTAFEESSSRPPGPLDLARWRLRKLGAWLPRAG